MTRPSVATLRYLVCLAVPALVGCGSRACANCDESRYFMSVGNDVSEIYGGPTWGGSTVFFGSQLERVRVHLPVRVEPEREMVEFFDGETPLEIAGVFRPDVAAPADCFVAVIEYDIEFLPDGEYLMVHRRSSAPPGLRYGHEPWSMFEGEEAVLTRLILDGDARAAARADAGP
ncbi:MAG: hypothetical protein M3Y87_00195 [Myxococcota bacterium]|nr:hypothetical protein [Myxococcota bacterium]